MKSDQDLLQEAKDRFLSAMEQAYEEMLEVNIKENKVLVWKSTFLELEGDAAQGMQYALFLNRFVEGIVYEVDQGKCREYLSLQALEKFLEEDRKEMEFYIRKNKNGFRMEWNRVKIQKMGHSHKVIILLQNQNNQYRTFLYSKIVKSSHDLIFGIHVRTKKFSIYRSCMADDYNRYLQNMDYNAMVISRAYGYIKPDQIDHVIKDLSLENVKAKLEKMDQYVTYSTYARGGVVRYKKYTYTYLDDDREIILVSRMDVTKEISKEIEKNRVTKEALKAVQQAGKVKDEFMSQMSHDMRTPLNAILGTCMLAANHVDNKEQVLEYLNDIMVSGKHLQFLIDEILDTNRFAQGKIKLVNRPFSLEDMVKEVQSLIAIYMRSRDHVFYVDMDNIVHFEGIGDMHRMCQLFSNLLSNAAKYTPDGGEILFQIQEEKQTKENRYEYVARIQDNGIGMSEEFQKNMFEPFTREKDTRINEVSGMGLGMTIVRNLVKIMGGRIEVNSKEEEGTEVIVWFSLEVPERAGKTTPENSCIEVF